VTEVKGVKPVLYLPESARREWDPWHLL